MSSTPTSREVWKDARWLAQALDPRAGLVRLVAMTPDDYHEASFLDDRILNPAREAHLVRWPEVRDGFPADARNDAKWIFHIGHVGSTLVSRLLGELQNVLAVREPRSLRDLTFFPPEIRNSFIPALRALMSRAFDPDQTVIVKTTSMVSEIAAELIGDDGRALFLIATPAVYLQTMLAGDRSQAQLQSLATYYAVRAKARGIALAPDPQNPAMAAALAWACEMVALEEASDSLLPGQVQWHDFDEFLKQREASLGAMISFFGLGAEPARVAEILAGPLINRYSKAVEFEFGPDMRRALLDEAETMHGASIKAALAMLHQAAEKAPLLERALHRSMPDC